jgi:hypothetical protein
MRKTPSSSRRKVSKLKVKKVVSHPRKPMVSAILKVGGTKALHDKPDQKCPNHVDSQGSVRQTPAEKLANPAGAKITGQAAKGAKKRYAQQLLHINRLDRADQSRRKAH